MKNINKQNEKAKLTTVIDGCNNLLPKTSTVTLLGKAQTPAALVSVFEAALTAISAVTDAKAAYQGAVQAQRTSLQAARALYLALEKFLQASYGKGSPVLGQFGFSTASPQKPTAEKKAAAAAQAKLTKKVRGTDKGKRQKLAITPNGQGGLVYVEPNGKTVPGLTEGPIPPAGDAQTGSNGTTGS
ncbi:MAG: hypothetical protein ACYCWW_20750 [Deltaproteobacteria bacterium]